VTIKATTKIGQAICQIGQRFDRAKAANRRRYDPLLGSEHPCASTIDRRFRRAFGNTLARRWGMRERARLDN
jgi:hypothetical protein